MESRTASAIESFTGKDFTGRIATLSVLACAFQMHCEAAIHPSMPFRVNPPDSVFDRLLEAAEGYFQLFMWQDAWDELEKLEPKYKHLQSVIVLRVLILNNLEKWEDAAIVGKWALRQYQDFGPLYLATADALRKSAGPGEAKALLVKGEPVLKDEGIYHFLLACYECQLGNLEAAKEGLKRAFKLDQRLRERMPHESDLEPVWKSL